MPHRRQGFQWYVRPLSPFIWIIYAFCIKLVRIVRSANWGNDIFDC